MTSMISTENTVAKVLKILENRTEWKQNVGIITPQDTDGNGNCHCKYCGCDYYDNENCACEHNSIEEELYGKKG